MGRIFSVSLALLSSLSTHGVHSQSQVTGQGGPWFDPAKFNVLTRTIMPCFMLCICTGWSHPITQPFLIKSKKKSLPTAKEQTHYLPVVSVEGRLNWGLALQVCHSSYNRLQAPSLSKACHKVAMLWFWLENSKVTSAGSIEKYPAPTWQAIASEKKKVDMDTLLHFGKWNWGV